jgi:glycerophosphoryl diester phosphodiesterase
MTHEFYAAEAGAGEFGERVPGPPWILGHRGAPREAPENTLAGLRRALDLGLDGVEYDLHALASGEAVLIHDETLDRTTSGKGPVAELTLPELAGIDAGSAFGKAFAGEPLPLLEEALDLPGNRAGAFPQHMIELKDPSLVGEVARALRALARPLSARIASFHRRVCLEARDCGLPTMLLVCDASAEDLDFVRDERI